MADSSAALSLGSGLAGYHSGRCPCTAGAAALGRRSRKPSEHSSQLPVGTDRLSQRLKHRTTSGMLADRPASLASNPLTGPAVEAYPRAIKAQPRR
jgi:hypothetical protein